MYEHILAPGSIGRMQLRNHVLMSPTETHFTSADGTLTWPEIDYYVQRARGGAALITTHQMQGNTKLDPIDPYPRSARVDDDAFIPMLSELTEAVHMALALPVWKRPIVWRCEVTRSICTTRRMPCAAAAR